MEKPQLLQLMESVIELDQELKVWMDTAENKLKADTQLQDETLPQMAKQRRKAFEDEFNQIAASAEEQVQQELDRINLAKQQQLSQTEQTFRENRSLILEKVLTKIRGDELV